MQEHTACAGGREGPQLEEQQPWKDRVSAAGRWALWHAPRGQVTYASKRLQGSRASFEIAAGCNCNCVLFTATACCCDCAASEKMYNTLTPLPVEELDLVRLVLHLHRAAVHLGVLGGGVLHAQQL